MVLKREPFINYRSDEERAKDKSKVVPVRLNIDDLKRLEEVAKIINQEKLSTVIKTLVEIGLFVIHEEKTTYLINTLFKNKRNNKRLGISVIDPKFTQM